MSNNISSNRVLDVCYGRFSIYADSFYLFNIDDGFTKITGYTQEDIDNGLSMLTFIPAEDLAYYVGKVETVLANKPECYLEHRITKKDGDSIYVLCFGKMTDGGKTADITIADVTELIKCQEGFTEVKYMLNTVVENLPGGVATYEVLPSGVINAVLANEYYWKTLGYASENDFIQNASKICGVFDDDTCNEIRENVSRMLHDGMPSFSSEYKMFKKDGSYIWVSFKFNLYKNSNSNKNPVLYVVMSDITESKEQIATIHYQNDRYELIQTLTNEIYFTYDFATDSVTLPKSINTVLTGDGKGNVIHNFFNTFTEGKILHRDDVEVFKRAWHRACNECKDGTLELRIKLYSHRNGYQWCLIHYIINKDSDNIPIGLFGKIVDISENHRLKNAIKNNEEIIKELSSKDAITKLDNKASFCKKFNSVLPTLDLESMSCAIMSADINDFSYINDNFGYDAGNQMLIDYANYISQQEIYILNCRIYSDFFYCLVYSDMPKEELTNTIRMLNSEFSTWQKSKYPAGNISICAGLFFIEDPTLDSIVCMDNSDLARRSIKKVKYTDLAVYDEELRKKRIHEKIIPFELNRAIETGKIEVFLQPKFDMKHFKIIGAEALSRWRNDDGTYRSPVTFIPILEKLGYVVQLDFYVYEQVLKIMKKWKDDGIELVPISINFSRIHNNYANFVDRVLSLANQYGIDKSLIEIEITESAFADNDIILLENIKRLRELGFKIDIDDFGIGESSLSTLLDVPVDIIKLDKKFIDNVLSSQRQQDFLKQLCFLIQTANKNIIFEGVELKEQSQFLCTCGFYMAQGWLFDKAIPIKEFESKYIYC